MQPHLLFKWQPLFFGSLWLVIIFDEQGIGAGTSQGTAAPFLPAVDQQSHEFECCHHQPLEEFCARTHAVFLSLRHCPNSVGMRYSKNRLQPSAMVQYPAPSCVGASSIKDICIIFSLETTANQRLGFELSSSDLTRGRHASRCKEASLACS